jgi:hypothetical protein
MAIKQRKAGRTTGVGTEQTETAGKKTSGKSGGWSPATLMMVVVGSEPHTCCNFTCKTSRLCSYHVKVASQNPAPLHRPAIPCLARMRAIAANSKIKACVLEVPCTTSMPACVSVADNTTTFFFWQRPKRLTRHPVLVVIMHTPQVGVWVVAGGAITTYWMNNKAPGAPDGAETKSPLPGVTTPAKVCLFACWRICTQM